MNDLSAVRACVLTPTPRLTITVESSTAGDEIHLHAGGQGIWQARLLARLGVDVVLCARLAGESGVVLGALMAGAPVEVRGTATPGSNGGYIHDRRSGERHEVAAMAPSTLSRHELDDLYGQMLVAGLDSDVCFLAGPDGQDLVPGGFYRRLARDLAGGTRLVVDLAGDPLEEVLDAPPAVVKVSDEELAADGRSADRSLGEVCSAMEALAARGVAQVVVTRGSEPSVALCEGRWWTATGPDIDAVDPSGAGDSFTAAYGASLAAGSDVGGALQVATAAASLNAARHGRASGDAEAIARLAPLVSTAPSDRRSLEASDT